MASTSDRPRSGAGTVVLRGVWAAALLAAASGCSRSPEVVFAPVDGTVTRAGRPVAHLQVLFLAEEDGQGPRAVGYTDEAGRFRLAADDGTPGAPVGRHRVCLIDTTLLAQALGAVKQHTPAEPGGKMSLPSRSAIKGPSVPPEYGRPAGTPLRAEVRPGTPQTIDFKLP